MPVVLLWSAILNCLFEEFELKSYVLTMPHLSKSTYECHIFFEFTLFTLLVNYSHFIVIIYTYTKHTDTYWFPWNDTSTRLSNFNIFTVLTSKYQILLCRRHARKRYFTTVDKSNFLYLKNLELTLCWKKTCIPKSIQHVMPRMWWVSHMTLLQLPIPDAT